MQKDTAYELQADIVKDYGDVRNDIQDVLNVVERGDDFAETVRKVGFLLKFAGKCSHEISFQFIDRGDELLKDLTITDSISNILKDLI